MGSKKRKKLAATVAAIQQRWGTRALRPGRQVQQAQAAVPHIATGFAALDAALAGIGGIPRGRISELLGAPTSGMTTVALKIVAQAQAGGDTAAYLDLSGTFDPDYAARCEIDLNRLLLVRPRSGAEALAIALELAASRAVGPLIFDATTALLAGPPAEGPRLAASLAQLPASLNRSPGAAIFLTPLRHGGPLSPAHYPPGFALPNLASLRLALSKERWLRRGEDVRGYEAQVRVLKNKLGPAGQQARLAIIFNGTVRGDGT